MKECYYLLPQIYLIRSLQKIIYLAPCAGLRLVSYKCFEQILHRPDLKWSIAY